QAAIRLREATALTIPDAVYWIELDREGRARLVCKPIDVSGTLSKSLFEAVESVSLVSATLTTSGSFSFIRKELGVPEDATEKAVESPFDFKSQAFIVIPEHGLPDPRAAQFAGAVADRVGQVVELCNGRTLGLFTSYRVLNAVYDRIRAQPFQIMKQGDLPRTELSRRFKSDVHSVLLGTDSFWTGIDVPGESLTGLVIDKLPFPHPEDPVINAICERDPNAFFNVLVPRAIIAFRQGVGRLIRSRKDFGVVVVLDRRILEKGYGKRFLNSLPSMYGSRRIDDIPKFLQKAAEAVAANEDSSGAANDEHAPVVAPKVA
ncbi:MAG: helicase C-terminal domain-containing protein, partial [Myxococcota bacterium]